MANKVTVSVVINVTKQDIQQAVDEIAASAAEYMEDLKETRAMSSINPVAFATRRIMGAASQYVDCDAYQLEIDGPKGRTDDCLAPASWHLPEDATRRILRFQATGRMAPFSFTLPWEQVSARELFRRERAIRAPGIRTATKALTTAKEEVNRMYWGADMGPLAVHAATGALDTATEAVYAIEYAGMEDSSKKAHIKFENRLQTAVLLCFHAAHFLAQAACMTDPVKDSFSADAIAGGWTPPLFLGRGDARCRLTPKGRKREGEL